MTDFENNNLNPSSNQNNAKSDINTLSQKYGVDSAETSAQRYAPFRPSSNMTAKTPQIVYDMGSNNGGIKIVYNDNSNATYGPEGRKTVYEEKETETIAEKRRRNAQMNGATPYMRHVASSSPARKREEPNIFTKTYKNNIEKPVPQEDVKIAAAFKEKAAQKESVNTAAETAETVNTAETTPAPAQHIHYEKSAKEKVADVFKSFIPWKGDKASEVIRKIVMNIAAIVVLVCFGYFINNYIDHQNYLKNKQNLNDLATEAVSQEDDELERQWAEIRAQYPDIDFPEGMNIKYAHLYATNQDLVGWLRIDNTNIDTPIPHALVDREDPDATSYYLYRNFYKQDDKYGIPYLEGNNTGTTLDKNNVIYGHNMSDGLSFTQINKYTSIEGFKESPIIQYSTLFEDYYFKVYAVMITNGYPQADNGYLFNVHATHFPSEGNFAEFIEAIDERKLYDTGVDINEDDILITLITCNYEIKTKNMGRCAVIGRLVRPGESTEVDTSKAVINENPRYPQVWYDERGLKNPYKDAYRWIPQ